MLRICLRSFVVLVMMAAAVLAGPQMTDIQDVLYKANGALFEGVALIDWNTFTAPDGTIVPKNSTTIRIIRGQVRVSLVPTTSSATPVFYTVRFNSEGKTQFTEYWSVPSSFTRLRLKDVRTQAPSAGNLSSYAGTIQDIAGLRNELDLRPARGPRWAVNRAAVIGTTGTIEAVLGADGDCVHVDGTSGPCGAQVGFVDGETPSGVADGSNRTFRLSAVPYPAESLRVFQNGLLMNAATDYNVVGNVITITAARTPQSNDVMQVWYRISGPVASTVDSEVPSGALNGLNPVFTLAFAPIPASSLQVYRNGVLQKVGVDYTLAANTITFRQYSVPSAGDILQACYRK